ncbi:MAG TPA: hypothetical protein VGQ83_29000 [Polyangia bacterium]|jgi:hypothetical protein
MTRIDDVNVAIEVLTTLTDMGAWRLRDHTIVVSDDTGYRTVTAAELHRLAAAALRAKLGTPEGAQLGAALRDLHGPEAPWLEDEPARGARGGGEPRRALPGEGGRAEPPLNDEPARGARGGGESEEDAAMPRAAAGGE